MRLFFAIALDGVARQAVASVVSTLRQRPELREAAIGWVAPERAHVTLAFLGEVSDADGERLRHAAAGPWPHPACHVEFRSLGVFPPRGRGRVIWIGSTEQTRVSLDAWHATLWRRVSDAGWRRPAGRFTPHVTLGRVRRSGPPPGLRRLIDDSEVESVRWTADAVVLYESRPSPGGVDYRVIASSPCAVRT